MPTGCFPLGDLLNLCVLCTYKMGTMITIFRVSVRIELKYARLLKQCVKINEKSWAKGTVRISLLGRVGGNMMNMSLVEQ